MGGGLFTMINTTNTNTTHHHQHHHHHPLPSDGGAIHVEGTSTLDLANVTFFNNTAAANALSGGGGGGAIFAEACQSIAIHGSTAFNSNLSPAEHGGAIYIGACPLTLESGAVFDSNTASSRGMHIVSIFLFSLAGGRTVFFTSIRRAPPPSFSF